MSFDLDDDEYRATRILTGADKVDEIKVGEYVRTNKGEIGYIFQINNENKYSKYRTKIDTNSTCKSVYLKKEEIVKHSPNIIDLIEVGDIVRILLNEKTGETTLFCFESQKQIDIIKEAKTHPIVSIVTKEQFASMEYKIGG